MMNQADRDLTTCQRTRDLGPNGSGPSRELSLPEVGDRVGTYRIERALGAGGMGTVYLARDAAHGRQVALKVAAVERIYDRELLSERLRSEAVAIAGVRHRAVPRLFEVGDADGRAYLATEYIPGVTMRAWGAMRPGWRDVVRAMAQIAGALAAVHDAEMIHGDVKPANMMRAPNGNAYLVDFGLARPWRHAASNDERAADATDSNTQVIVGTPTFLAPEQIGEGVATPASDQFAFCASLYELIYDEHPFFGQTPLEVLSAILDGKRRPAPDAPGVPAAVRAVIERGLSPDAADRFPSMRAVVAALAEALASAA